MGQPGARRIFYKRLMSGAAGVGALATAALAQPSFPPIQDVMIDADRQTNLVGGSTSSLGIGDYSALLTVIPPARNLGDAWEIYATEWSEADERGYEAFVTALGRSGCISIDDCLRSPANPYRDLEDETLWLGDCTDMVYVLRGYYAWKNGLPFSFEDSITARDRAESAQDLRYTSGGNRIISRSDVIHPAGSAPRNGSKLLRTLFNIVSTAMLRTHPADSGSSISSFYPVTISRDAVRPGVAAYDVYGHVSIVYDVTDDGRILLISSHPDYTVSREPYGANIMRTGPELGSGLKAWRPLRLVGATRTAKGTYVGGRLEMAPNAALADFSLEQYFGTHPDETGDWEKGRFEWKGRALPFHDYVHAVLRKPGTPVDPLDEMAKSVDALCAAVQSRKTAVDLAIYAGLHVAPAPDKLPPNIYGTYGDWERYATPSRDARLKTQAVELRQLAETLVEAARNDDGGLAYVSHDLAAALLDVYERRAMACRFTYKRSDDSKILLNLDHVLGRLFDLSFDPFHCPEKRWGASGRELATCPADKAKEKWYTAQRYLRNAPSRTYDLRTDFAADDLKNPAKSDPREGGIGLAAPPDVNVRAYLVTEAGAHETATAKLPKTMLELSGAVNGDE